MKETVEISMEEYVLLRNKVNKLQSEIHRLQTIVDSINLALQNGGVK
ncbi:hypothetical protein Javan253_0014 [Streptococcus phage Javan253]|nr:hypothetical protein [Streptococcus henryi]QBX16470.1 hypothetical protein Javan253_0014 [Streptococcus phage Javan253]